MRLNKKLYTIGDIGELSDIPELMRNNACGWLYFVYAASSSTHPLAIGTLHSMEYESGETVILGIAPSGKLARELAVHITLKALSLDNNIKNGIKKLMEAAKEA